MTTLVENTFNFIGLDNFLKKISDRIDRYRMYRKTVDELSVLTDRELRDLGISRSMIHSIAMEVYTDNHEVNPNLKGWV